MNPDPLPPWALANTVTAFATVMSGLLCLALTAVTQPQPRRWLAVYAGVFVTGVPTVWYHGYGETFIAGVFDGGTNLLLAWLLQVAVLGDFYDRRTAWIVGGGSALVNVGVTIWKLLVGPTMARRDVLSFGAFGGFHLNELVLIADALLVVALFYLRRARIPHPARPTLHLLTSVFVLGLLLATASNHQVDWGILAYHATWHLVAAFGFVVLWVFNLLRFASCVFAEIR